MVRLNAPAPDFALDGIANGQARRVRLSDVPRSSGVRGFQARRPEFARRDCDIVGVSVDAVESHRA